MSQAHEIEVFADYHQFYLWDAGMNPQAPEEYTDEDVERMVKVAPHVVVVQPVRNSTVPVRVEVHDRDPGWDPDGWDHVVECSLDVSTGHLQVHECTGSPRLDLQITPGSYRVRVLFTGLDAISNNGLEGDDRYVVSLWPAEARALRVLKHRRTA
jgi:hypothetical protein